LLSVESTFFPCEALYQYSGILVNQNAHIYGVIKDFVVLKRITENLFDFTAFLQAQN